MKKGTLLLIGGLFILLVMGCNLPFSEWFPSGTSASGNDTSKGVGSPSLSLSQGGTKLASGGTYDFGSVIFDETKTITLTLKNTGDALLNLNGMSTQEPFLVDWSKCNPYISLKAGESISCPITFSPTTAQDFSGQLGISSNDPEISRFTLILSGTGINPPAWTFPSQYRIASLATDASGNVYVHGAYVETDGLVSDFTAKLGTTGTIAWLNGVKNTQATSTDLEFYPLLYHNSALYEVGDAADGTGTVFKSYVASTGDLVWEGASGNSAPFFVAATDGFYDWGVSKTGYDGTVLAHTTAGGYRAMRGVGDGTYLYFSGYESQYNSSTNSYVREYIVSRHSYDLSVSDWKVMWGAGITYPSVYPEGNPVPLAVANNTLYLFGKRNDTGRPALFAYDLSSSGNSAKWYVDVSTSASETPANIVADSATGAVYAISTSIPPFNGAMHMPVSKLTVMITQIVSGGTVGWQQSYQVTYPDAPSAYHGITASPDLCLRNGTLYVADGTNTVKRFDASTGQQK